MGRRSNAVMRTIHAVIGSVLVQRDGDDFGDHLRRVFLAGRRMGRTRFFQFDGRGERGSSCPAIEAKHQLMIRAAARESRFFRLGFRCRRLRRLVRISSCGVIAACKTWFDDAGRCVW